MYIVGAGGHGKVVVEIFELLGCELRVVDRHPEGRDVLGNRVESELEALDSLKEFAEFFVAVGDAIERREITERWRTRGHRLARAVHPSAIVSPDARVGAGTCIMAGAIVQAGCELGQGVIVNTGAVIDHDCVVGDYAHVGPGVRLAGNVEVGGMSWVGIGSTVREGQRIGASTLIGAGAVVVSDVPDDVIAYGVPCRIRTDRSPIANELPITESQ